MKIMQPGLVALAIAATHVPQVLASPQSATGSFVEDSKLTLTNRHYYFNHDNRDGAADTRDWAHALLLDYRSGFTRGTVGLGADAFAYGVLKLDEQGGGNGNVALDSDGNGHSFNHVGAAIKAREPLRELRRLSGLSHAARADSSSCR